MPTSNILERDARTRFKAAQQELANTIHRLANCSLSVEERIKIATIAMDKLPKLEEQEAASALLIGRAQNRAQSSNDFAAVTDQVIAALDRMTEELQTYNAQMQEILARYETTSQ